MAARSGDRNAFGTLVDQEAPAAFRVARAILRNEADAEDAVQDAFMRAWRDLPRLRELGRWPGWFRRIVVRAALDRARTDRQRREVGILDVPEAATDDPGPMLIERAVLERALAQLGPDDRAILALRYAADLEVPDVAATLGIPLGTAKSRLHRAVNRLRAILGEPE